MRMISLLACEQRAWSSDPSACHSVAWFVREELLSRFDRQSGWRILDSQCERLFECLKEITKDWGTHLSSQLYNEALVHHFGGVTHCICRHDVWLNDLILGTHSPQMYSADHAFTITSLTRNQNAFRRHLERLLEHIDLRAIQWINLNHSRVEITTLETCVLK